MQGLQGLGTQLPLDQPETEQQTESKLAQTFRADFPKKQHKRNLESNSEIERGRFFKHRVRFLKAENSTEEIVANPDIRDGVQEASEGQQPGEERAEQEEMMIYLLNSVCNFMFRYKQPPIRFIAG